MWHGYFRVKLNGSLSQQDLDLADTCLCEMGKQWGSFPDENPCYITQVRKSLDSCGIIVEAHLDQEVVKSDIASLLATTWGISEAAADALIIEWEVFSGADLEAKKGTTRTYLDTNSADWEEV